MVTAIELALVRDQPTYVWVMPVLGVVFLMAMALLAVMVAVFRVGMACHAFLVNQRMSE